MPPEPPTQVRHRIVAVTTFTAVLLYLDRVCIAEIAKLDTFQRELGLSKPDVGLVMSAFFYAYALAQVPAGWLADRFGARGMMAVYIALWSVGTVLTGWVNGFVSLVFVRVLFGIAQAGAFPISSGLVKRWMPLTTRGRASGLVAFGGRLGGALAPMLTAWLLRDHLGWRAVLTAYGASGLLVAWVFWTCFRESPSDHPGCNEAERELIGPTPAKGPPKGFPARAILTNGSLWLMCLLQFGVNVGWVFLVSWLPTYFKEVKHVDPAIGGMMSTTILVAGLLGTLTGGCVTDWLVPRLGLRWGRALPLVCTKAIAGIAYVACLWLESPWAIVATLALVAFMTDLGLPIVWSFMQDVGGRSGAAVFGWANMWGNLGAGLTIWVVPKLLPPGETSQNWNSVFLLCATGFFVASLAALGLKADRPVEERD
ncbi:MAG: putative sulfoacetate transporter SauU [Verrucomicrobiota bacterium]|jgi:sugar phosphate permease